jgi:Undecaprenyl-phosphate galactose phosphotransferase WbaP
LNTALGNEIQEIRLDTKKKSTQLSVWQRYARLWMIAIMLMSDTISIIVSGFLSITARLCLGQGWQWDLYSQILLVGTVCLLAYASVQLYPGNILNPVEELRRTTLATSITIFSLAGLTFFIQNPEYYSRLTMGLTWLFGLILVPLVRYLLREIVACLGVWGEPVIVVGYGDQGKRLVEYLREHRTMGYDPVAIVDDFADDDYFLKGDDLPVFSACNRCIDVTGLEKVKTAIVIVSEVSEDQVHTLTRDNTWGYQRIILIYDLLGLCSLGVTPITLNGMTGFKVHDNLLNKFAQFQKHLMDIVGACIGLLLLSPIFGLIAIAIKLTSRGPVFFHQDRVGKDGRIFRMVKFRTMFENSHQILADILETDQLLKTEWDKYQKLKNDPRLSPMGGFLRRYSIDELPQLWNVLKGEMSLIGPRPFFLEQKEMYGDGYSRYIRTHPGLTGMWQVNVRNQSEFTERSIWDEYYVRNWSIWLDIFILAKTFLVVLRQEGAY